MNEPPPPQRARGDGDAYKALGGTPAARWTVHYDTIPHGNCPMPAHCDCECLGCLKAIQTDLDNDAYKKQFKERLAAAAGPLPGLSMLGVAEAAATIAAADMEAMREENRKLREALTTALRLSCFDFYPRKSCPDWHDAWHQEVRQLLAASTTVADAKEHADG